MKVLVTGSAGFIGSKVCELLLEAGIDVIGLDSMSNRLYPTATKAARHLQLKSWNAFSSLEGDVAEVDLHALIEGCDVIVHEAALPGLTLSWDAFADYNYNNVTVLGRLLKALTAFPKVRLVHASTSSVYGRTAVGDESQPLNPVSPYGVTKMAAEQLVYAYAVNFGVQATVLRYFSVYGPHQRPDMAYERFCHKLLLNETIPITGNGQQSRSNTYIDDVARATVAAVGSHEVGGVFNICGDEEMQLIEVVRILADELDVKPRFEFLENRPGDQFRTKGDASQARTRLRWVPRVSMNEGLRAQARSARDRFESGR